MKLRYLPLLALAFGANASIQDKLAQCTQLSDNELRLACFDALAKQVKANPDMAVTEQAVGRSTVIAKTQDPVASFGIEEKVQNQDALQSINAIVTQVNKGPYGKLVVVLDNGQIWKQTDSSYSGIKADDKVELKKGVFGAVYLSKEGGRTIRVVRSK
ncbi:hypothetical protein [Gallaecimonas pentaromativorans]|uniref:hypothetical protein n=1 Tax=Gallaecimonas pentaromativorans TaxID=584787 RepID=UPI003A957B34